MPSFPPDGRDPSVATPAGRDAGRNTGLTQGLNGGLTGSPTGSLTGGLNAAGRLVLACCRRPWLVILASLILCGAALFQVTHHFAMTTDIDALISSRLPYRQRQIALDAAFPHNSNTTVVVVDGATPEIAETAAARLFERLQARGALFRSLRRPDGGAFFDRYGLMLLPLEEVQSNTEQLIAAQPFLGPLAADPSLRGVMGAISTVLTGVERGQASLDDIRRPLESLGETLHAVSMAHPAFFSWRALFSRTPPGPRETRRFILAQPVLNYDSLAPGSDADAAIREDAAALSLDASHGVTIRLTGAVPLADDEVSTLAEGASLMGLSMLGCLVLMLWLAVRSWRTVLAILVTTVLGLVLTAGLGLLTIGRFNLISVAFIPLFVGLGVDFAIQLAVRARAERRLHPTLPAALAAAGHGVGGALALAAAAIAVGFFAFLPTSYIGVSELGTIAGAGMVIAFALSLTLLPALLTLLRPGGEAEEVGFGVLAPLDGRLVRHRRAVFAGTAVLTVAALALLPGLSFDFNPLHLRNEHTESVSTLTDLSGDPDRSPYTIEALEPSLAEAEAAARKIASLPEVAQVVTLASFIPADQDAKLAVIRDAADLLSLTLDPVTTRPPPTDAETISAMTTLAAKLRDLAARGAGLAVTPTVTPAPTPAAEAARHLATALESLAAASPATRAAATDAVIMPLEALLTQIRTTLTAGPVTRDTLPEALVRDWVAPDGRARMQAFPRAGTTGNEALARFGNAVQAVLPEAVGPPISLRDAGEAITGAFLQAGLLSALAITVLLAIVLRRVRDVALTVGPVILAGVLTLASCVVLGEPLNFANIIALPLLFGIGVAFNIYFVMAWRHGERGLLASPLTRAIVFSALATATGFGSLWLSSHPGTASMGRLLMLSLFWVLAVILILQPALLGRPAAAPVPGG